MPESDRKPQNLIERNEDGGEALGDYAPFTLGSRLMAPYIAMMTPEWQEAFEAETAQIHSRVRLQDARKTKKAEERGNSAHPGVQFSPRVEIPSDINSIAYRNLNGRVRRFPGYIIRSANSSGSSNVFIGHLLHNGKRGIKVAIKVRGAKEDNVLLGWARLMLICETMIWRNLDHPNILKLLGLAPDQGRPGWPALITPYCENGTVNEYLKLHPDTKTRLLIIKGVSEGLRYLHQLGIMHGDLNPANIFIHDDGRPLLYDFAPSVIHNQFTPRRRFRDWYQPPELLATDCKHVSLATDVYSFAFTSYEIWTGLQPFRNCEDTSKIIDEDIAEELVPEFPDPAPPGTDSLWKILQHCWKIVPEERLDMEAVAQELAEIYIPPQ